MKIWTDDELEFIRNCVAQNRDTVDIYDAFKQSFGVGYRSYDSVQKKVKQFRDALSDDAIVDETEEEEETTVELYEDLSVVFGGAKVEKVICKVPPEVRSTLKKAQPFFIEQLIESHKRYKPCLPNPPVQSQGTSLVVQLSDIHVGQQTPIFGLEVCRQRLLDLPIQIHRNVQHIKDLDEIVLMLMGDMVEGEDIFPTQPWHVQCSALRQVQLATTWHWEMILTFKELFKVPVRIVTVPGNHGRVSKSANEKTNWDNFLYLALSTLVSAENSDLISMDCNFEPFKEFVVKDRKGQMYHQGTKHTGTPAMREKIAGWAYNSKATFVCHGHWHEWHIGSWQDIVILANGSLCGPNDLSQRMAQMTPARQGYFLVTPGRPLWGFGFAEWPSEKIISDAISFDEKKRQQEDGPDPSDDEPIDNLPF